MNIQHSEYLRIKADDLKSSFEHIKTNPMDLNLLMEHVAVLSSSTDTVLRELADIHERMEKAERHLKVL